MLCCIRTARRVPPVPYSETSTRVDADASSYSKRRSNPLLGGNFSIQTGDIKSSNNDKNGRGTITATTNATDTTEEVAVTSTFTAATPAVESHAQRVSSAAARRARLEAESKERVRLRQRQRIEEQK
jgi:hypothetical protein